jgi:FAD/FMN-containing dehydrogenase
MIGGIVANNSSGMCCGTEQNAYRTLESLRLHAPERDRDRLRGPRGGRLPRGGGARAGARGSWS